MNKNTLTIDEPFTRIINDQFDTILISNFGKRELKVIFAIIRKTYGFNKLEDEIALSQLSQITGIQPQHISQTIKKLVARRVITKRKGKRADALSINKNHSEWIGIPKTGIPKIDDNYSQNGSNSMPETGNTKDSIKNNTKDMDALFFKFYSAYPKKNSKGQAEKTFIKINPDEQLVDVMIASIEKAKTQDAWKKDNGKFIPYPAKWLNDKAWEDEGVDIDDDSEWALLAGSDGAPPFDAIIARLKWINREREENNIEPIESFKGAPHETPCDFRRRVAKADGCNDYSYIGGRLMEVV